MAKIVFTSGRVGGFKCPPENAQAFLWDASAKGPGLRATPSGKPAYVFQGVYQGKSATHLARVYAERRRNFVGQHFWARGYFVSTVGPDETVIDTSGLAARYTGSPVESLHCLMLDSVNEHHR